MIYILDKTLNKNNLYVDIKINNVYVKSGYENKDWYIPSPALNEDDLDTKSLSKEYIREVLNYFRKY